MTAAARTEAARELTMKSARINSRNLSMPCSFYLPKQRPRHAPQQQKEQLLQFMRHAVPRRRRRVILQATADAQSTKAQQQTEGVTRNLERSSSRRVQSVREWAQRNGFQFAAITPATFDGGLKGVALRKDVKSGEVMQIANASIISSVTGSRR